MKTNHGIKEDWTMDWDEKPTGGMISSNVYKAHEIDGRKITPIFFMIDVSSSMAGTKIGTVNSAMEEIMRDLSDFNSSDAELRFAVLSFGTNCTWETGEDGLIPCDGYWSDLTVDGLTYFNTACRELKSRLSGTRGFFNFAAGKTITPPVLILLTDGYANDANTISGIEGTTELQSNKYYLGSYKIAIAIGEGANQELCRNFTGDMEMVFTAYNSAALQAILTAVVKGSVTVSSSGSADTNIQPSAYTPNTEAIKSVIHNEIAANEILSEDINVPMDDDWD